MRSGIYFVQRGMRGAIKIGYSTNIDKRVRQLQTSNDERLRIIGTLPGDKAKEAELHRRFEHIHIKGEWFRFSDELKHFIKNNCSNSSRIPTQWRKGDSLDKPTMTRLRALVDELGAARAAKAIGLAEMSVLRAIGGQGLRRGTIALINLGLDAVSKSRAA